ncbi:MAG: CPBP family intramembrane glutamic endopeptidase [Candidatus Caenarcaniphilales bacterium]|nr:CPBP family intramembrane glutamic endopeptidase [Candidatus Caenarcaniphilales bacterium]
MLNTTIQNPSRGAFQAWKGLFTLGTSLFIGLGLCIFSVICYGFLFFEYNSFNTSELSALLNAPSTLAFQMLLINTAYIFSLIWLHYRYKLNYKTSLGLQKTKPINLVIAFFMVVSVSILVDQLLLSLSDGPLSFLSYTNLAGNLNLAYVLGNLNGISVFSFSLLLILTIFSSPLLEELFFRGYLWTGLRNKFGFLQTLFISSFFFAIIHLDILQGLTAFFIGLIYGFIVEKTKSVWPAVAAHIGVNLFTYLLSILGVAYGLDGADYPVNLIVFCAVVLLLGFLFFSRKNSILDLIQKQS